jgi:tetratricopeptide (TPR) repeat protein
MLLSLLEGAGVLVGLAIGAAAFYGLRNSRETREEFKEISKDAKEQLAQLRKYDEYLKQLPAQAATVEKLKVEQAALLDNLQSNFLDLFQAYQELGLRNYREAYDAAKRVLARDATNPQALYIAGWLEFQYVEADLDDGILHLEQALKQVPTWPSAKAALGVLLRRKGLRASTENERAMYMVQAEAQLREALNGLNFDLIDPNMESFWGPLGGALRDSGRYEEAITAYENACQVTPGSSYPRGNLAALYLMKVQAGEMSEKRALDTFRETRNLARVELSQVPNDYFLMMDIAMASAILGHEQAGEFETAQKWLDQALDLPGVTPELRSVSIRGWGYLRDYCPTEWDPVLDFIYKAIQRLEEE